ncbi:hypothetical protein PAEVO_09120 [Paenibacillus sp. GM2FR]|uniref:hypothetical protein n=1 Tax=Paenibacillus sp. GM2FR TaxID=2059268 RepID=UPI000CB09994|nr:hypothetical protein [Paenibacillus sp. GM2FR]PJN54191.1 hypothetical protein PAEVO_09120 [Paenibacillus sp. GM2FR]
MREQTISALELAAGVALFLGAVLYAFHIQTMVDGGISAAGRMTQEQHAGVITVEMTNEIRKLTYKGSEVLFTLREVQAGGFDMYVDGVRFRSGSNQEELDLSVIDTNARYDAEYVRRIDGFVESIQFVKVR